MEKLKLTLTDSDGVVLETWDLGENVEPEYDIENLDSEPECDFYTRGNYSSPESLGQDIFRSSNLHFDKLFLKTMPMTKGEAVKQRGIENHSFDYALPQTWVDMVIKYFEPYFSKYTHEQIVSNLVWYYEDNSFGRPFGITDLGDEIVRRLPRSLKGN